MYDLQLSSHIPLRYRHGFHSRLENLNKLLRYFLGMLLPAITRQSAHEFNHSEWTLLHVAMKFGLYLHLNRD